jgi:hypothetical protein
MTLMTVENSGWPVSENERDKRALLTPAFWAISAKPRALAMEDRGLVLNI